VQQLNIQIKGLYTDPNPLSEVPPGGLVKAKNTVVDKDGVVEIRRGQKKYGTQLTGPINKYYNYDDHLLVHHGSTLSYDADGLGSWADYPGVFSPPDGAVVMRGMEANKNFYFNSGTGVKKLDQLTVTPVDAGMVKALDASGATSGSSGFLATANQVAYRIVWGIIDNNNNLILGAPSQRIIVINSSGGSRDVALTITVPADVTVNHFYQIYRSQQSGGVGIVPNDEMQLVYENNPTSGEISAKSISVTDSVPDALMGASLYTSPSQQGISQENDQPPACRDMTLYKGHMLYANTRSKQRLTLTMLSIAGSIGIQVNDTVTIGATTYTAKGTENAAAAEFKVTTSGTPAENIEATAQSLARVINQYASNTEYYAYYISGYNDLPGKILIEERDIGGDAFAATSTRGAAFNPTLPTSGTDVESSNDSAPNGILISKQNQPEAVPLANIIYVGSANANILRIIALRDSVFIYKEDGVFRLTGETLDSFFVALFDATVILTAPESAEPFNNQIFSYTSQGVVAMSDTGSAIMSKSIEMELNPISTYDNFATQTFAVAYNSDRKFLLWTQIKNTDTYPKKAWVYNSMTNQWTTWERNRTAGIINSADDKLYMGGGDNNYTYQEKKSFGLTDYSDDELVVAIVSNSGTTVTLVDTTGIVVGNVIVQGGKTSIISAITDGTHIEVEDSLFWNPSSATVYSPISVEIETVPQTGKNPGILKHFRDLTLFFRRANFRTLQIGFKSNISPYIESVDVSPVGSWAWGRFPWGQYGWGGTSPDLQPIRTYIHRNKQRCHWYAINIQHSTPNNYFAIAGWSTNFEQMSDRMR